MAMHQIEVIATIDWTLILFRERVRERERESRAESYYYY
jgi:hypothetical protein